MGETAVQGHGLSRHHRDIRPELRPHTASLRGRHGEEEPGGQQTHQETRTSHAEGGRADTQTSAHNINRREKHENLVRDQLRVLT